VGDLAIDPNPNPSASPNDGEADRQGNGGQQQQQTRQQWVRANFTEIFGTSPEALQAGGTDPRQ
jgi:hypothetical protein